MRPGPTLPLVRRFPPPCYVFSCIVSAAGIRCTHQFWHIYTVSTAATLSLGPLPLPWFLCVSCSIPYTPHFQVLTCCNPPFFDMWDTNDWPGHFSSRRRQWKTHGCGAACAPRPDWNRALPSKAVPQFNSALLCAQAVGPIAYALHKSRPRPPAFGRAMGDRSNWDDFEARTY